MTSHQYDIPAPPSLPVSSPADGPFEAEEEKAECSAVPRLPPNVQRQQNGNMSQHTAIDRLPDEVLEKIFRFDRGPTSLYPDLYGVPPPSIFENGQWDWHRLVHVCRRWRYMIFNVPRSLELRLFCTYGTPVKKNLDCWPALPIVLQYAWPTTPTLPVDEDNIIAALQHPDRIYLIHLTVTTSLLEKLTILAQKRFPVLEHLGLKGEPDKGRMILNEFLVGPFPSLRTLQVIGVAFPALQQFLPFAKDLVSLHLVKLPYLMPAALRNLFPGMTRLESLRLDFHSPISRHISESGRDNLANAPPPRAVLPALGFVEFSGTCEDLECLLSNTEAPVLQIIDITFFNQATIFDTSQFVQFLSHTKAQTSYDSAQLRFSESYTSVTIFHQERYPGDVTMGVRCMSLDWQLSCMGEICANLFPIICNVQHLNIYASSHFPREYDAMDPLPLLELFRSFSNVTSLVLTETVALYVKSALKQEVAIGVLPYVHEIKVRMQQNENNEKWMELLKCFSPPDSSINHNAARDSRREGTAMWFFQGSAFEEWKSSPSLLWIYGKPGSGKSIMCSAVIEEIRTLCHGGLASIGYFYFDFCDEDKRNHRNLLLSFLLQLSAQSNICCDILSRLHSIHRDDTATISDDALTKCLKDMLSVTSQLEHPVYLIMDALDECPNTSGLPSPREQVLELVKDLVELSLSNLHICVTSRPEADIRATLEPLTSLRISLHDQAGQKEDIIDYVTSVVYSDVNMQSWRDEDKKLVIETLCKKADGMFRWVSCQLDRLRHCLPTSVRWILGEFPEMLDETYERVLREIHKRNEEPALRLLQCLAVAIRPLRVQELAEVLAVDFDAAQQNGVPKLSPDRRWEDQHKAILSTCSSLVTIVDEDIVQFSHSSVKEFLTSERLARSSRDISKYHIALEPAHTTLAQACLAVLLQLDSHVNETDARDIPLVGYAAQYWIDHARFENVSSMVRDAMEYFFDADKPHWAAWLRIYDMDQSWWAFNYSYQMGGSPLYYASLCGLFDLVEQLVSKHPQDVIAEGGRMKTPLVAALYGKHFRIAELLHQHGADVDVRDDIGTTPLQSASNGGLVDVARWLLNHGADVHSRDNTLSTSLHLASQRVASHDVSHVGNVRDQLDIMRLLLEYGANPNARDDAGSTPLHVLCSHGKGSSKEAIRLLLDHGANIDAENNKGKTALQLLSARYYEIMELLSELGAN